MEHKKDANDNNKNDASLKTSQLKVESKQDLTEDPKAKESDASNKTESKKENSENKTHSKTEKKTEETTENVAEDKKESIEGKSKKENMKEKNKKENTVEDERENSTEDKSEEKNENQNENQNKNKKLDDAKSTVEAPEKEEEQMKNEKNNTDGGSSSKNETATTRGNDIGKFLEFVQSNKDDPELIQKLLSIVNVNPSVSEKKEETTNDKKTFEINGISVKREEQYMKSDESEKREAVKREDFNIDMFQRQSDSYSNEMSGFGKKQQSSFCKMFEKNGTSNNNSERNQNKNNAKLSESSNKKDTLNRELLSTLISDFAEKKNFEDVKGMLDNMKMRENEAKGRVMEEDNSAEVIKKKHDKLVEDNDEYDIDTTAVNDNEREAASILSRFSMNVNTDNADIGEHANNINAVRSMCASSNYKDGENANEEGDFKLYHSKYTWVDLHVDKELINVLVLSRFYNPSKIQAFALPIILNSNKNLIAQSQNGSGKTLTFVIGMLSKINRSIYNLQAMCICPTRELSQQNYEVIKNFANYLKLNIFLAVPLCERYNKNGGWQLYVGTPGKTLDFLKRKYIDTRNVKLFVLDEADDLIDVKNNMATQVDYIKKFLPKNCQVLLFSATYNKQVLNFADRFAPQAIKIRVRQEDLTLKCVKQYYLLTENDEHKYYYLSELYCSMTISQCVIFVNSKQSAFKLYKFMTDNHHNVTLICADSVISRFTKNKVQKKDVVGMDPKTRDTLMSDFKKGISKVLICTDLLSRGIDIPSISLVINFDLPYIYHGRIDDHANSPSHLKVNMETYIHRIGRTGRFGSKGMAINFINKQQLSHIKQIENYYQCTISDLEFDSELMKTSITKLSL